MKVDKRWKGKTVACIASGPSLNKADCNVIERAGIPAIAVNSSWKLAPFCEIIFAGDFVWWNKYRREITIAAERWTTCAQSARAFKLNWFVAKKESYNSGLRALQLAINLGASVVLLLGYDADISNGTHWHGPHKLSRNPDVEKCKRWINQFKKLDCKGATVINCNPESKINAFKKIDLRKAIESFMPK